MWPEKQGRATDRHFTTITKDSRKSLHSLYLMCHGVSAIWHHVLMATYSLPLLARPCPASDEGRHSIFGWVNGYGDNMLCCESCNAIAVKRS